MKLKKIAPLFIIAVILIMACEKESDLLNGKNILSFSFQGVTINLNNIDQEAGIIDVSIPLYDANDLVAIFSLSKGSEAKIGEVLQESGVTANDFNKPVVYTIVAENGTTKDYTVTVSTKPRTGKRMLLFKFEASLNSSFGITEDIVIEEKDMDVGKGLISVAFPYATNVTNLIPTFTHSEGSTVKVGDKEQESGVTPNNFSGDVVYTVTPEEGDPKLYSVKSIIKQNSKAEFHSFEYEVVNNNSSKLTFDEEAQASEISSGEISFSLPYGADVSSLVATFEASGDASIKIGDVEQESGQTSHDYTTEGGVVTYVVTSQDSSTEREYTVRVSVKEKPSFEAVSYYEGEDRIGAGDFEKEDLFKISDLVDGTYSCALTIGGITSSVSTVTIENNETQLGGEILTISNWSSISNNAEVAVSLVLEGSDFDYTVAKEQNTIKSWQDLQGMKHSLTRTYKLDNDIVFPDPGEDGFPTNGFTRIGKDHSNQFKGTFDGQGHVISNFYINVDSTYSSLFGYTHGATIKNVGVKGEVNGGSGHFVAILVGYMNKGTIEKCYTSGSVKGGLNVGSFVGQMFDSAVISDCYSRASVSSSGNGTGGLVGYKFSSSAVVKMCYAAGLVTGSGMSVGGLVARSTGSNTSDSYWDVEETNQPTSAGGGEGKTTLLMKQKATFAGWDFENVWDIDGTTNNGYPFLKGIGGQE